MSYYKANPFISIWEDLVVDSIKRRCSKQTKLQYSIYNLKGFRPWDLHWRETLAKLLLDLDQNKLCFTQKTKGPIPVQNCHLKQQNQYRQYNHGHNKMAIALHHTTENYLKDIRFRHYGQQCVELPLSRKSCQSFSRHNSKCWFWPIKCYTCLLYTSPSPRD